MKSGFDFMPWFSLKKKYHGPFYRVLPRFFFWPVHSGTRLQLRTRSWFTFILRNIGINDENQSSRRAPSCLPRRHYRVVLNCAANGINLCNDSETQPFPFLTAQISGTPLIDKWNDIGSRNRDEKTTKENKSCVAIAPENTSECGKYLKKKNIPSEYHRLVVSVLIRVDDFKRIGCAMKHSCDYDQRSFFVSFRDWGSLGWTWTWLGTRFG